MIFGVNLLWCLCIVEHSSSTIWVAETIYTYNAIKLSLHFAKKQVCDRRQTEIFTVCLWGANLTLAALCRFVCLNMFKKLCSRCSHNFFIIKIFFIFFFLECYHLTPTYYWILEHTIYIHCFCWLKWRGVTYRFYNFFYKTHV